jgi:hypothetical protein
MIPFHKQTDPNKQAGQHVYSFDREPYLKHSNVAPDVTLSDYIARKQEEPQRITFEEWASEPVFTGRARYDEWRMSGIQVDFLRGIWETALKKGKL